MWFTAFFECALKHLQCKKQPHLSAGQQMGLELCQYKENYRI